MTLTEGERLLAKGIGKMWIKAASIDPQDSEASASVFNQALAEMAFSKATGRHLVIERMPLQEGGVNPHRAALWRQGEGSPYYPCDVIVTMKSPEDFARVAAGYRDFDNYCFVCKEVSALAEDAPEDAPVEVFHVTGYALGKHLTARGKKAGGVVSLEPRDFEDAHNLRIMYRPVDVSGDTGELFDVESKTAPKKGAKPALTGFD